MRILLTGGGTGGHIFPLIAVAREIQKREHTSLVFLGPCRSHREPFNELHIKNHHLVTGKVRRYMSFRNVLDIPLLMVGFLQSYAYVLWYMPDVVFSKGGYGAFPVVIVAWMFRIPVVAHESDSVVGLTNRILSRFTKVIITSFPTSYDGIPQRKQKNVGNPVRAHTPQTNARNVLNLNKKNPLVFVMGGSQGAEQINNLVFDSLDMFLKKYEIVHQVGAKHIQKAREKHLDISPRMRKNYHCFAFLDEREITAAYRQSKLIISRAGSGSIFEIANAGKPSILIPLASSAADHQRKNARIYEKAGACAVLEPNDISLTSFQKTVRNMMNNKAKRKRMCGAARQFARPNATKKITRLILKYAKK